jgi:hypothetical protein
VQAKLISPPSQLHCQGKLKYPRRGVGSLFLHVYYPSISVTSLKTNGYDGSDATKQSAKEHPWMGARGKTKEGKTQRTIQGWVGRWSMTKYNQPWTGKNILETQTCGGSLGWSTTTARTVGKSLDEWTNIGDIQSVSRLVDITARGDFLGLCD